MNEANKFLMSVLDFPKNTEQVTVIFKAGMLPQVEVISFVDPIQLVNGDILRKLSRFELVEKTDAHT